MGRAPPAVQMSYLSRRTGRSPVTATSATDHACKRIRIPTQGAPLTSEPPLADATPLTSEPPLTEVAPLTSEPTVRAAAGGSESPGV
ncbi:hypothetical protein ACIGO8_26365 [Streptomyces sp. NPDC053493]|uniref:hypothetical protein n=1 Tax=Streptomyces sp. NPDC053493 TaxID=3365705 RepID=UPI0037D3410D